MNTPKTDDGTPLSPPPCSAFARSEFTVTQRSRAEDALHFAHKHEQRVWGNGSDHEKAHAEVERLEAILASWPNAEVRHGAKDADLDSISSENNM
jgi:hypothetical protein